MLVGLALEGIEEVQLIHFGIEKVPFSLLHTQHEGWVGHVDVHLLDDESFGSLTLVLVGAFAVTFVLPSPLPLTLLGVACPDVRHDAVDGLCDALLAASRRRTEDVHQRGLMLHVVDVSEAGVAQMACQGWEDGLRHGRLIDGGRLAHEQTDEAGQFLWHLVYAIEVGVGVLDVAKLIGIIVGGFPPCLLLLAQADGLAHNHGHAVRLLPLTSTVDGGEGPFLLLAEGGYHLFDPRGIVVAQIAQIAAQREDKRVARTVLWLTSEQFYELACYRLVGDSVVFLGEVLLLLLSAMILIHSMIADMMIISTIMISRLGILNSSTSRKSSRAIVALRSMFLIRCNLGFRVMFGFMFVKFRIRVDIYAGIRLRSSTTVGASLVHAGRASQGGEEPCLVDEEDVFFGHDERRPCQVFHTHVVLLIAELQRHPLLSLCQVHALWHDEDEPESLQRRCDVHEQYSRQHLRILHSQFFALCFPPSRRVGDVVFVVDAESAGYGVGIESSAIAKGGVGREYGQLALEPCLHRVVVFLPYLSPAFALQCILYLCADVLHPAALSSLVEELGGAYLHLPAPYAL